MGQILGKRELLPESKTLSDPASRTTADADPQDEVFGMNDSDVNQNKNRSNKKRGDVRPRPHRPSQHRADQPGRRILATPTPGPPFSRDAPGREDNTFKGRPSESDELHTIEEAGGATSENSE